MRCGSNRYPPPMPGLFHILGSNQAKGGNLIEAGGGREEPFQRVFILYHSFIYILYVYRISYVISAFSALLGNIKNVTAYTYACKGGVSYKKH